jgi:hypothetical protein
MTDILKPVRRRTVKPHNWQGRRLLVILEPGDILAMREERRRQVYRASLATVFEWLVMLKVNGDQRRIASRVRELVKAGTPKREAKRQAKREVLQ